MSKNFDKFSAEVQAYGSTLGEMSSLLEKYVNDSDGKELNAVILTTITDAENAKILEQSNLLMGSGENIIRHVLTLTAVLTEEDRAEVIGAAITSLPDELVGQIIVSTLFDNPALLDKLIRSTSALL